MMEKRPHQSTADFSTSLEKWSFNVVKVDCNGNSSLYGTDRKGRYFSHDSQKSIGSKTLPCSFRLEFDLSQVMREFFLHFLTLFFLLRIHCFASATRICDMGLFGVTMEWANFCSSCKDYQVPRTQSRTQYTLNDLH